jgi:hypothetical protein
MDVDESSDDGEREHEGQDAGDSMDEEMRWGQGDEGEGEGEEEEGEDEDEDEEEGDEERDEGGSQKKRRLPKRKRHKKTKVAADACDPEVSNSERYGGC